MKQRYFLTRKRFTASRRALIDQANIIIAGYQAQDLTLTLRQLYYQFVSRDLIANTVLEYKRLGEAISDGRLNGDIDWDALVDRTRNLQRQPSWQSPEHIIQSAEQSYNRNKWETQPSRVELWVEKDALSGVFSRVCDQYDLPLMACKGYMSQSEQRAAGERFADFLTTHNQQSIVLHFGDHDPSGMDMTRDIDRRLSLFAGYPVDVRRIALNMDQVEQYDPPPNPAKKTDSRHKDYVKLYGDESWELDALEPVTLRDLVEASVKEIWDKDEWNSVIQQQEKERGQLTVVRQKWAQVQAALQSTPEDEDLPPLWSVDDSWTIEGGPDAN